MLAQLKEAIHLDPHFADAYDLLAYVQVEQGQTDAGLESSKTAMRLSPRNLQFQTNFGQYLMVAGKMDDAEGVFQRLKDSDDPLVSVAANKNLELIAQYKSGTAHIVTNHKDYTTEKEWGTGAQPVQSGIKVENRGEDEVRVDSPAPPPVVVVRKQEPAKIDRRPIKFLKGTLVSVACAQDSSALLHVAATVVSQRVWSFATANRDKLVLIGADTFSCDWKNQRVAVNYRESSAGQGDLVSLEIQ